MGPGVLSAPPSRTNFAASTTSGSTSVNVTSDSPIGGRFAVPLKMQSDIRSARSDLWLCSPRTQEMASTMLDLPQPLGPMMHVSPLPLKVICVFSQNDLKPTSSTLRSLSKISPFYGLRRVCAGWVGSQESFTPSPLHKHRQKRVPLTREGSSRDKIAEGSFNSGPAAWRYDGGYGKII